ncbi:MAG: hypothetical protein LBS27_01920 [Bifidobacteriaceae bacterium]|nr:hypothetical protein [Bifidobacteriaceae bacterium]
MALKIKGATRLRTAGLAVAAAVLVAALMGSCVVGGKTGPGSATPVQSSPEAPQDDPGACPAEGSDSPLLTTSIAEAHAEDALPACGPGDSEPRPGVLGEARVQIYATDGIDLPAEVNLEPELGLTNLAECQERPGSATFFVDGQWHIGRNVVCSQLDGL